MNQALRIDHDVPIPPRGKGSGRPLNFPFDGMWVGDSFVMPPDGNHRSAKVAASQYGKRHGMTFSTRRTEDGGLRVWRTA